MNERNCSSCDTPVPADAAFCPNCGVATPTDLNTEFGDNIAGGERLTETGIVIGTPGMSRFVTTTHMVEVLKSAFDTGRCTDCGEKTLWGLQQYGYTDEHGCITPTGRLVVMERMSLEDQCRATELLLEDFEVESIANPELTALNLYEQQGYSGASCEGGAVLTLLKSLCLDCLAELNFLGSRQDACTRFLEAQLTILKEHSDQIIGSIRNTSRQRLLANFNEVYACRFVRESFPGLDSRLIACLYDALTVDPLVNVMRTLMTDPYTFRSGWPDLTLVRDTEVRLVEVKTTDRLHASQLVTIPIMRDILPAEFSVVQLKPMK